MFGSGAGRQAVIARQSPTRSTTGKLHMSPIARIIAAGAALSAVAFAGVAAAQDYRLNPTYGAANLSAGFTPDPYVVNVQSGGSINASIAELVLPRLHRQRAGRSPELSALARTR